MNDDAHAANRTADDSATDDPMADETAHEDGILAELRANPRLAAVELGSLAVAASLPLATVWALVVGPRPSTDLLLAVVVVGAAFAALWTLVYPAYDAI